MEKLNMESTKNQGSASVPNVSRSASGVNLANHQENHGNLLNELNKKLDSDLLDLHHQDLSCLNNVSSTLLPWDRFSEWLYAICLVTFDIEIGQALESIYPTNAKLTEREKSNICYLSFPDSNSGCMGDTRFHFRTRLCPIKRELCHVHEQFNRESQLAHQIDQDYLYGFVYFRQVRDKTARRGYFQKSLVLLSRFPFVNLFQEIVSRIARPFFEQGQEVLKKACRDIDHWPAPLPGTHKLVILETSIQTTITHRSEKPNNSPTSGSTLNAIVDAFQAATESESVLNNQLQENISPAQANVLIPSIYSLNVYKSFLPVISHIQLLWELVITCEPLIVMAPTPDACSEVVQSLVSIISPLKYSRDYRPFFTIHDSEFKEYTSKKQSPPPVILGVTNPFFAKTFQHWPHIIRIGDYSAAEQIKEIKIQKSENLKTLDNKAGLYTKYKPFLQKDRIILKKLLKGIESGRVPEVQNVILSKYFQELTQSFLIPLERYLTSLMPLQKNISPFRALPLLAPFNPDDFLRTLDISGPQLTTGIKGDWQQLYRKFFRCANFARWHESRLREMCDKIKTLHAQSMARANLLEFIADKAEVEVIDLVLRLKEKLSSIEAEQLSVGKETIEALKTHLTNVIETLPHDIQTILQNRVYE